ncbi:MAG: radical SAM family heme chaperone HemW [Bacilli bacterium]|nr:radical SAM family heme chaperone HemW [Bacilli bacterium]
MISSAYIHIPFCKNICSYCDFCKMFYKKDWVDKYLIALTNEIKDRYHNELLRTIYIGGGTPSCLDNIQLKYLLKLINHLNIKNLEEFTIECNLNDITDDFLQTLQNYRVNRISIGIQSFNPDKLKTLNRFHTYEEAEVKIALCHKYNINNINLDLIYGVGNETLKDLKEDLRLFLKLKPTHISTYSLIIEDNTLLKIKNQEPISDELDYNMYEYICKKLKSKGYNHYEISNFALNGYESKHNLVYWHNEEYYGFGLGASGYIEDTRYENTKNLTKYLNNDYGKNITLLGKKEKMDNELMLGFRLLKGINNNNFKNKYDEDIESVYPIKPLLKNKDLIKKKGYIFINPSKLYIMNEILIKMI